MDDRIKDLNYKISRVELEVKNLERTIEVKRKHKLLNAETERDLKRQIGTKRREIALMEAEIRKIENEALRTKNLEEGLGL